MVDLLIGIVVCVLVAFGLNLYSWHLYTKDMSDEEKEKLLDYYQKHPGCGSGLDDE